VFWRCAMHEKQKIFSLYCIVNKINEKSYIGQTIAPKQRWYDHKQASLNPKVPLQFAIKKYGKENFEFKVIAQCKTQDDANFLETELVKQYDSFVRNGKGYNATLGGSNAPKTEEWKQKIRQRWQDPEYREHILENLHSPEVRAKAQASLQEIIATRSPEEQKAIDDKIRQSLLGKKHTEERKRNNSLAHLGQVSWNKGTKGVMKANVASFKPGHLAPTTAFQKGLVPWNKGTKGIMKSWNKGTTWTHFTPKQISEMKSLCSQGLSSRKIATKFNTTHSTVLRLIK
jgi:group I intron endonuclease